MMRHILKRVIIGVALLLSVASARAQFLDSTTGLLQMPTAVMNREGTFMATVNYLNQHATPERWVYNTCGYGLDVAIWDRLEMAYVCTIMYGTAYYDTQPDVPVHYVNQDRHFAAKLLLLREGDFGKEWMPALAIGTSDPLTGGDGSNPSDILETDLNKTSNAAFNRYYIVASKHFDTEWGQVGTHLGYQYGFKKNYPINGPCAGIDWRPIWLQTNWLSLNLIAEYDSRTFNIGFIASLWDDHIEAMIDLQALKWVSFGLRYKMHMK